jgi:anaerobic ribonucleoside-triphosphate reductase activating protein
MNYANIKYCDIANGPGVRVSLFVSGCRHHCKNCFNQETWDFLFGKPFTDETLNCIIKELSNDYIAGFSLLGGEPFEPENQRALAPILAIIKNKFPNKSIWCWTGWNLDKELSVGGSKYTQFTDKMLQNIDVLVDGPFVEELKNVKLVFRGSSNQRIIDLKATREHKKITTLNY